MTAAWISDSLSSTPNTASESSTSPTSLFFKLRTFTFISLRSSRASPVASRESGFDSRRATRDSRLFHNYQTPIRPRHRAADHQKIVIDIDLGNGQILDRHAG